MSALVRIMAEGEFGPLRWFKSRSVIDAGSPSTSYVLLFMVPFTQERCSVQWQLLVFDEP